MDRRLKLLTAGGMFLVRSSASTCVSFSSLINVSAHVCKERVENNKRQQVTSHNVRQVNEALQECSEGSGTPCKQPAGAPSEHTLHAASHHAQRSAAQRAPAPCVS